MQVLNWISDNWLLFLATLVILGMVIEEVVESIFRKK